MSIRYNAIKTYNHKLDVEGGSCEAEKWKMLARIRMGLLFRFSCSLRCSIAIGLGSLGMRAFVHQQALNTKQMRNNKDTQCGIQCFATIF